MKINIGVIFGGKSVEHEISIVSALQAIAAIDSNKYSVVPIYISKDGKWFSGDDLLSIESYKNLDNIAKRSTEIFINVHANAFEVCKKSFGRLKTISKLDVVFPIMHGTNGEDGVLQGLLELKNIPYVGCNVLSSAVGMDKVVMKMILKECDIPTVDYAWFYDKDWHKNSEEIYTKTNKLGYPLIVKPSNLGSSVGISTASNDDELREAVENAGNFTNRILVEKMVTELQEINCSVIGDSENQLASLCEEPMKSGEFLSYEDKYVSNGGGKSKGMSSTKRQVPANIPDETSALIQELARKTFKALDCNGVARIDFLIDKSTNSVYVNEINAIPGSLAFYLWEATNKTFKELINDLIDLALKRHRERDNYVVNYNQNIFKISGSVKMGKS